MNAEQTNWIILTGAPSSGKTKVIEHLAFLGFSIRPEAARIHIDDEMSRGLSLADVRKDEALLQKQIFDMKMKIESLSHKGSLIFWDRGLPDSIVYLRYYKQDPTPAYQASRRYRYQQIFFMDRLPFDNDGIRTETPEWCAEIEKELYDCYAELGYSIIRVPVASISERVRFILKHVEVD